jgi:Flp pilus assembly secretin CpaC
LQSFTYRDIGTNIECRPQIQNPGRFALTVTIEDTSIYKDPTRVGGQQTPGDDFPAFRTLRAQNSMVLRDGQTTEFTVASDKVTGEVLKADVSISVSK